MRILIFVLLIIEGKTFQFIHAFVVYNLLDSNEADTVVCYDISGAVFEFFI